LEFAYYLDARIDVIAPQMMLEHAFRRKTVTLLGLDGDGGR
jgi:hypothetical protein